jgi:hypothetical protein
MWLMISRLLVLDHHSVESEAAESRESASGVLVRQWHQKRGRAELSNFVTHRLLLLINTLQAEPIPDLPLLST